MTPITEIEKAWRDGKGLFGIYIHALLDRDGKILKGRNPFDDVDVDGKPLSQIVRAYDPTQVTSRLTYNNISTNLAIWIDAAMAQRNS